MEPQCFETGKCRLCGRMTSRTYYNNRIICLECLEHFKRKGHLSDLKPQKIHAESE